MGFDTAGRVVGMGECACEDPESHEVESGGRAFDSPQVHWMEQVPDHWKRTKSGKRVYPHKTRNGRGVVGRLLDGSR